MKGRLRLVFIVLMMLSLAALAFAAVPSHKEYASMSLKECQECHKYSDVAFTHASSWNQDHRLYAEKKPNICGDCHNRSFCFDCHFGGGITPDLHKSTAGPDYMPRTHRSDWRELHPIKAADDPRSCYRCHDERKFCQACHQKFNQIDPSGLAPISHRRGWSDLSVSQAGPMHSTFNATQCPTCHPNSMLPKNQWSLGHAREARRNLASCESCHPDGNVCLKCHSATSGLMVNPHPRGWNGSLADRMRNRSNNRTCIKCH